MLLHHRLGYDGLGSILIPLSPKSAASNVSAAGQPTNATAAPGKVLTGDLDSSLASLAENLSINKSAQQQVKLVSIIENNHNLKVEIPLVLGL